MGLDNNYDFIDYWDYYGDISIVTGNVGGNFPSNYKCNSAILSL